MHALHSAAIRTARRDTLAVRHAVPAAGMFLLALGMIASALLGPLGFGVITFAVSESAETQLVGSEIVSLLVAAPLALLAGVAWLRGYRLAPVLALGPGVYAAYIYTQVVVGPEYSRYDGNGERAFPLYVLLVLLGGALAAWSWVALRELDLPAPPRRMARALGATLAGLGVLFAVNWIATSAQVILRDTPPDAYLADPNLFWTVRLMDLAFVIPVGVVTGIALLRNHPSMTRLAHAWLGAQTLLVAAVAGMAWAMLLRDDPEASIVFLVVTTVMAIALAAATLALWRRAGAADRDAS